jgi:hypothetical protein
MAKYLGTKRLPNDIIVLNHAAMGVKHNLWLKFNQKVLVAQANQFHQVAFFCVRSV